MKQKLSLVVLLMVLSITLISSAPLTKPCGKPADVVFVLDTSSSIWPFHFRKYVLTFVQNVVKAFDVGPGPKQTRIGAMTFSNDITHEFDLNTYSDKEDILQAISMIKINRGNTHTYKALKYVTDTMFDAEAGGRTGVAHIVIVLTDGRSDKAEETRKEAARARQNGAQIFAIGVGQADEKELLEMASKPGRHFMFKVTDFDGLENIKLELAMKTCEVTLPPTKPTQTTTTTTTTTSTTTPTTTTSTSTTTPTTTSTTITTTTPTTTSTPTTEAKKDCDGKPADIFFVLDSSSSIRQMDFEKRVLGFLRDVVSSFSIGPEANRVGVMTFSSSPRLVIGLDKHTDKDQLLAAISPSVIRYTLGGTNTAAALSDVRLRGFHKSLAREGVAKIAVVITDGQSWDEAKTKAEAEKLRESEVLVYAIGVGKGVKQAELESIANEPKEHFVFSVDDFAALSEIKDLLAVNACGKQEQGDQPRPQCGSGPTAVTFAFDANSLSLPSRRHVMDQIHTVAHRLSYLDGDVRLAVTSGSCPPSLDASLSSPREMRLHAEKAKRGLSSHLVRVLKDWQVSLVEEPEKAQMYGKKVLSLQHVKRSPQQALVLILDKENVPQFGQLAKEVSLLQERGVAVFVVIHENVGEHHTRMWEELVGRFRIVTGVTHPSDYSGYIMEFMCAL